MAILAIFPVISLITTTLSTDIVSHNDHPNHNQNAIHDPCYNFTYGHRFKGEIESPGFPNDYPPNLECISILSAPFGFTIRLDFVGSNDSNGPSVVMEEHSRSSDIAGCDDVLE